MSLTQTATTLQAAPVQGIAAQITQILAVWGAVVSTLALGWNILVALRDKGKLLVQASVVKQLGDELEKQYILLTVTNVGRRPMFVEQIGGKWHKPIKSRPKFYWTSINAQLKEAELWRSQPLEIKLEEHGNVSDFEVYTAGGEIYRLGRSHRKRFLAELAKALDEIKLRKA